LQDIDAVDLEGVGRRNGPGYCALANPPGQHFAAFRIQEFAVAQTRMGRSVERMTAAANTGPNKAPRPTSSTRRCADNPAPGLRSRT